MGKYGFRAKALLSLLVTWAVLATAHVFYFSIYARDTYLAEGDKLAVREGTIPAPRGKIIDKDGIPLAWTEKYFELRLNSEPEIYLRKKKLFSELEKILGGTVNPVKDGETLLLKSNLAPLEMLKLDPLTQEYPELRIAPRFERRYVESAEVKALLGKTVLKQGRLHGLDGLELAYEETLSGKDGAYTVMLDRNGIWMKGSWKQKAEALSCDVKLEKSLDELRGIQGRKNESKDR